MDGSKFKKRNRFFFFLLSSLAKKVCLETWAPVCLKPADTWPGATSFFSVITLSLRASFIDTQKGMAIPCNKPPAPKSARGMHTCVYVDMHI